MENTAHVDILASIYIIHLYSIRVINQLNLTAHVWIIRVVYSKAPSCDMKLEITL